MTTTTTTTATINIIITIQPLSSKQNVINSIYH
jgi:hypothetical protein